MMHAIKCKTRLKFIRQPIAHALSLFLSLFLPFLLLHTHTLLQLIKLAATPCLILPRRVTPTTLSLLLHYPTLPSTLAASLACCIRIRASKAPTFNALISRLLPSSSLACPALSWPWSRLRVLLFA